MTGRTARCAAAVLAASAAAFSAACSDLPGEVGDVVLLEVRAPLSPQLEAGDTIRLTAVALDRNGAPVAADLRWRTPDTTVAVDSLSGLVTGRAAGTGRVQATDGSLASGFVTFTVQAAVDSLAVTAPQALVVAPDAPASAPLGTQLLGGVPPAPVAGRWVRYRVVDPVFADTAQRTIELSTGRLADSAVTGSDGAPTAVPTLRRIAGRAPPVQAVVEVEAARLSGRLVPGSGQRFVVQFQ